MRWTAAMRQIVLLLAFAAITTLALGAGVPATPKEPEEPAGTETLEGAPEDAVAKVDDVVISRADLSLLRRRLALNPNRPVPNNEQLVDQLINRVLLQRYFAREGLQASGGEITRQIQALDAQLRQQGSSYPRRIATLGLTAEEHAGILAYEISLQRLSQRIQKDIKEEDIKKEFDAHPEWYDGSRIRISQIFIRTEHIANEPEKLKKAKERIDKLHADLVAEKDFARLARDFSEGGASSRGGDRGFILRKGTEQEEDLRETAWKLKVGQFTKPIRGNRGWHILKVTDREPARLTPFGAKPNVLRELTRGRFEALIEDLKAKAKIQKFM